LTRIIRGLAVGALALLVISGCSESTSTDTSTGPSDRPTVAVTAQPQDAASAQQAVEQLFSLIGGGDWASVWDQWTSAAQAQVPKDAFVNLLASCPPQGSSYKVSDVRSVDPKTVSVSWTRDKPAGGQEAGTTSVKYESGAWHIDPDAASLAAYKNNTCA
jgi:hypothetical protein